MRILFLSAQLPGHLDWGGYLPTAAELARRGHDTLWASGAEVQARVELAGVPFHSLSSTGWRWPPPAPLDPSVTPDPESLRLLRQQRALDQWLGVRRVTQATEEICRLGREFRPDLILSEMFVAASGLVAELLDVPLVVAGWPAPAAATPGPDAADPMVGLARTRLEEMLTTFQLAGHNWTAQGPPALRSPHLHVTYWSPSWYGGASEQSQTAHVGGIAPDAVPPPADLPSPQEAPWVLLTLGTSFNRDPNFFINAAHAAHRMGCLPLIALGSGLDAPWFREARLRLPDSSVMRERIDFAAVLPYTAAAIHHGGAGTTHALVVRGVPQVVIPHAADQARQAQAVARTGAGLHIAPRSASVDNLVAALSAVLPDRSEYRARARALQAEFRALGGIPAAADLLESKFARANIPVPPPPNATTEVTPCKP